jgi:antitoxin Phd
VSELCVEEFLKVGIVHDDLGFTSIKLVRLVYNGGMSKKARRSSLAGQVWQLQTAKARFSEVFRLARSEGPQLVTKQGKEAVVIIPVEEFDKLTARSRQPKSLVQFFRESPLVGLDLDFERDRDTGQDVEL